MVKVRKRVATAISAPTVNTDETPSPPTYPRGLHPTNIANRFKPGNTYGNGGRRKDGLPRMSSKSFLDRFWGALNELEEAEGIDYFKELLLKGMKCPSVRNTLLAKFLPSKMDTIVTVEDVKRAIAKVVAIIKKHVDDKNVFAAIAAEVANIELVPNENAKVGVRSAKAGRKATG